MAGSDTHRAGIWETAVSRIEPNLLYRGYPVDELASGATYLETAYLLIAGELPSDEQLADWQALLLDALALPSGMVAWLKRVPEQAAPIDILQSAVARCQLSDPAISPPSTRAALDAFPWWLGVLTAVTAARQRLRVGEPILEPRAELSFAGNLWWLLKGTEAPQWIERPLDRLLVIGAEHGLNPATCAVRFAAASDAEFGASLLAGLSVAKGPRFGGVAADILEVLSAVRTPDRAVHWVRQAVQKDRPLAGFVHRTAKVGDARADWLTPAVRDVAQRTGHLDREELASAIEQAVWEQKHVLPTMAWNAVRMLDNLGIAADVMLPLFALSRLSGWAAHDAEQRQSGQLPVFRTTPVGSAAVGDDGRDGGERHYFPQRDR